MPPGDRRAPLIVTQRIFNVNHKSDESPGWILQLVITFFDGFPAVFRSPCQVVILHKVFSKLSKFPFRVFVRTFAVARCFFGFLALYGKNNPVQPAYSKKLSTFPTDLLTPKKLFIFNHFLDNCKIVLIQQTQFFMFCTERIGFS